jgi:DNA sulfur modification protein DndB
MPAVKETTWDLIISGKELEDIAIPRIKEFIEKSIKTSELDKFLNEGWETKKQNQRFSTIKKSKKNGDGFEDEVWSIFYKMGFKYMNKSNAFAVLYSQENGLSKQIDVIAIDDEVCLLVECKESSNYGTKRNFQMDINEVPAFYDKVCQVLREKYPRVKFKYIFATKNIFVGDQDKSRMKENNIIHFDYSTVLYYKALVNHLGSAAKYQLLGQIFAGQKISNLEMKIPAIRGKMGTHTYYSFVIQPEQLLKVSYILHKTNANNDYEDLLPSYQRLIKKERLNSVRDFINNKKGFFPNSLVISIDSKRDLVFDLAPSNFNQDKLMKVGVLHLPQIYQSAYIIDGQHRLYGYSDSMYSSDNSIPVVAFENLDKTEQLKLFMEINLNQKAVPKALRNILEIDVYYDSEDAKLSQSALLGKLCKHLGEDSNSALKGRIVIGEDAVTKRCNITIENLKLALEKTRFFNKLKKNGQIQPNGAGLLDLNNNHLTFEKVYPLLAKFFNAVREEFKSEWDKDDNYLVKNNLIGALIRILDDMIYIQYCKDSTIINNIDTIWTSIRDYFANLLLVISKLSPEERKSFSNQKGAAAPGIVWRQIQMKMFDLDPSFTNADIENYYTQSHKNYNDEAKPEIIKIKQVLIENIKAIFSEPSWMREHISEELENDLTARVNSKNIANERKGINLKYNEWDEINFLDIQKMINHGSNWTKFFKELFNKWIPDSNKNTISVLIHTISRCYDSINNGSKINGTDFNEIHNFFNSIMGDR